MNAKMILAAGMIALSTAACSQNEFGPKRTVGTLGGAALGFFAWFGAGARPSIRTALSALSVVPGLSILPPVLWALVQLASLRLPVAIAVGSALATIAGALFAPALSVRSPLLWRIAALAGVLAVVRAVLTAHGVVTGT